MSTTDIRSYYALEVGESCIIKANEFQVWPMRFWTHLSHSSLIEIWMYKRPPKHCTCTMYLYTCHNQHAPNTCRVRMSQCTVWTDFREPKAQGTFGFFLQKHCVGVDEQTWFSLWPVVWERGSNYVKVGKTFSGNQLATMTKTLAPRLPHQSINSYVDRN